MRRPSAVLFPACHRARRRRRPACPRPAYRPYGGRRLMGSDRGCAVDSLASMPITRDEVAHLARLARLALSEQELDHFAGQLDVIIASVARVQEVAAEGIPPPTHALPTSNVCRADVLADCLGTRAALDQAPAAEQDRFRVPRILDED